MMNNIKRFGLLLSVCFVLAFAAIITLGGGLFTSQATGEEAITFSQESGIYTNSFNLTMSAADGSTIYYTTDGSVPTVENGVVKGSTKKYTQAINVTNLKGTAPLLSSQENSNKYGESEWGAFAPNQNNLDRAYIVRAIAVDPEGTATKVSTRTYFVGNNINTNYNGCAVMSIVTDPDNLLNEDTGIYVRGNGYKNGGNDITKSNFCQKGKEWERAANMEFFDGSGDKAVISTGIGIRIHGGYTRRNAQKSLNIYFREDYDYGAKNLKGYELIPGATLTYKNDNGVNVAGPKTKYSKVMIRNGGNDSDYGKYQDVFIQKMVEDRAFGTQSSRPCMVYLNGEFWGLYNLTEKYSDSYLSDEYDVKKSNVLMYKCFELDEGEDPEGAMLAEFEALGDLDMTNEANYKKFQDMVDIDSFIDYYATEIYINNNDWWSGCNDETPRNNIQFWRVVDPSLEDPSNPYADGKWRYMLYDTEWSMGIYGSQEASAEYDSIKNHAMGLDNGGNGSSLFTALMKNVDFRQRFTNTLLDLRNWNYEYDHSMSVLENIKNEYTPLNQKNRERWNAGDASTAYNNIKNFLSKRSPYVLKMLEDDITELSQADRVNVNVSANIAGSDLVKVNTITPDISSGWSGTYYKDYPITVKALNAEGYQFSHWIVSGADIDNAYSSEAKLTLTSSNAQVQAMFVKPGEDVKIESSVNEGYIVEYIIPFNAKKNAGDKVGFEVQVNDATTGQRNGTLNLFAQGSPYNSGTEFGKILLTDDTSTSSISDRSLSAIKTDKQIVADGLIEEAWSKAMPVKLDIYQRDQGDKHADATVKFLWDSDNLYVLTVVDDNDMCVNTDTYRSDSVEIFYDEDAANPNDYDKDMFQHRTLFNGTAEFGKRNNDPIEYNVVSAARIAGYVAEYAIPFKISTVDGGDGTVMKMTGDDISFEIQVIDSISSYTSGRIGKLNMFATGSAYNYRSQFGLVSLVNNYPGDSAWTDNDKSSAYVLKAEKAVNVDGYIDDVWMDAKPLTLPLYTAKNIEGVDTTQKINATARLMWDEKNMYVLVVVDDPDKCRVDGESDCVELFFDEDTSKKDQTDYPATAFQYRVFADGTEDAEVSKNYTSSGYNVKSGFKSTASLLTTFETPEIVASPSPSPSASKPPVSDKFTVKFNNNPDVSITTYTTKDYTKTDGIQYNQTEAYARSSDTGEIDVSGDGQVNFTIVPKTGCDITDVVVEPAGSFKNKKGPEDTGMDNTYRITKITGDLTVTITTVKSGSPGEATATPTVKPSTAPTAAPTTKPTAAPTTASTTKPSAAPTAKPTDEPKVTADPNATDKPDPVDPNATAKPGESNGNNPSATQTPGSNNGTQATSAQNNGNNGQASDSSSTQNAAKKPGKIKNLKVKKKGVGIVGLYWKKAKNAKKYEIRYTTDKRFKKGVKKLVVKKNKATVKKLKSGKQYYFKVRCVSGKLFGKYTSVKKIQL